MSESEKSTGSGKTEFVVLAPHRVGYGGTWGKGETVAEAKAKAKQHGAVFGHGYEVLEFGPESEWLGIDDMGYYRWRGPEPKKTEVKARKKAVKK